MRIAAVVLASLIAVPAAFPAEMWIHLRVQEKTGKEGRVSINLPLSAVEALGPILEEKSTRPHHHSRLEVNGHDVTVSDLREIWKSLQNKPDATLVRVDQDGEHVKIIKQGDMVLIQSTERHSDAEVRISSNVIAALLSGNGDELNIKAGIEAMSKSGSGDLVIAGDDDSDVRIWVDADPEGRVR